MLLTTEQKQALEEGQAVRLEVDGRLCILMAEEVYQRTRLVFEHPDADEMADIMDRTWGDDPALELYQDEKR